MLDRPQGATDATVVDEGDRLCPPLRQAPHNAACGCESQGCGPQTLVMPKVQALGPPEDAGAAGDGDDPLVGVYDAG